MKITEADITIVLKDLERSEKLAIIKKNKDAEDRCRRAIDVIKALAGR